MPVNAPECCCDRIEKRAARGDPLKRNGGGGSGLPGHPGAFEQVADERTLEKYGEGSTSTDSVTGNRSYDDTRPGVVNENVTYTN